MEMSKNKLVVKWGSNSSSDSETKSDVRKTRSMSKTSEKDGQKLAAKEESVVNVVKESSHKQKVLPEEEHLSIMKRFLDEKDESKWNFFVDKLGKKDSSVLKRLLSKCTTSSSESEPEKKKRKDTDSNGELKKSHKDAEKGADSKKSEKNGGSKKSEKDGVSKKSEKDADSKKSEKTQNLCEKDAHPEKSENDDSKSDQKKEQNGSESKSDDIVKSGKGLKTEPKDGVRTVSKKKKKKGKGDGSEGETSGGKSEVLQEYYVLINNVKTLVRVVDEGETIKKETDSDTSISEQKVPKTLKPLYTVSDDEEDKDRKDMPGQVDGNGFDVIYLGSSSDDALQSQQEVADSSMSSVPIFSSSVEEIGDRISLAAASTCPSNATYSDTTDTDNVMEKSIGESLGEIFPGNSHGDSHAHTDSHGDSHADIGSAQYQAVMKEKTAFCKICPSSFYSAGGLKWHDALAHRKIWFHDKKDDKETDAEISEISRGIAKTISEETLAVVEIVQKERQEKSDRTLAVVEIVEVYENKNRDSLQKKQDIQEFDDRLATETKEVKEDEVDTETKESEKSETETIDIPGEDEVEKTEVDTVVEINATETEESETKTNDIPVVEINATETRNETQQSDEVEKTEVDTVVEINATETEESETKTNDIPVVEIETLKPMNSCCGRN